MKWLENLSTKGKLYLGFSLMIVLLAAVVVTAQRSITSILESQKKLYSVEFANALGLQLLRNDQNGVRADVLTMMILNKRSDQEVWHQDMMTRAVEIGSVLTALSERAKDDPQTLRRLEELRSVRDAYVQTRDNETIPLIYDGKIEQARNLILGIEADRYGKMRSIATELGDQAGEKARQAVADSEQRASESMRSFAIFGLVAAGVALVAAGFLNRVIAIPLKEISGTAGRIASGHLTVLVPPTHRADEAGVLQQTFRTMVENLRKVNQEIQEGAAVLASSASEILAATTQVASGAAETAAAISETTTTVEEVRQTAQLSSQKAKSVVENSQKSAQVSQAGRKAVDESVSGMSRIQQQWVSVGESIMRLSEQSQAIGEIIASVNDLAEQSNLLAVNAAIEAAKAGEQGKGFSVVAQEVRSLAEQSKQATAQVRSILNDVQKAVNQAVLATEQGNKAVEAGVKQSQQAGESIRLLSDSIAEATQAATQIAASAQQQLAGTDQVALAMENIKVASTQNVAGAKQAESAAQNLHELGLKLKQLVDQYKV